MEPIFLRLPLFLILIATYPAAAWADVSQTVRIDTPNGRLEGTLHVPEADTPSPAVLMLHGFDGHRDVITVAGTELSVFALVANGLAEAGIASLRIDFRGSGNSSGRWADTTFSGQIADARAALGWLGDQPGIDPGRVALLGWSQGGLVAAHAAAAESPHVNALLLWAPVTIPIANFSNIFGAEAIADAIAARPRERVTLSYPWGGETTLRGAFFDEMLTTSTAGALAGYPGPVLVVMGSRDGTITPQPGAGDMLVRYHNGSSELVTLDMNHIFDALEGPDILRDEVLPRSVDWLDGIFER